MPRRPSAAADDGERRHRVAVAELHEMLVAVAPDAQLEGGRQGIHDRHADAVQAARDLVGVAALGGVVELPAGVKLGHDDLRRRDALFAMDVGRDAAAVIGDRARAVGVERDRDLGGVAGQGLVDGVVDDLVDHMVQAGAVVGVADIHARPLAHGIEPFQDLDRIRAIGIGFEIAGRLCHGRVLAGAGRGSAPQRFVRSII